MAIRTRRLPEGWYPSSGPEAGAKLDAWTRLDEQTRVVGAVAAIAPHAGWHYSGRIAWSAWMSAGEADVVVIVGGHLPAGAEFRIYMEDGFDTPFGAAPADADLRAALARAVSAQGERGADNTVEVHLPMAARRFPGTPVVCVRAPNDERSAALGSALADYQASSGRRLFVLGSTDLTHYGKAYGFEPGGPAPGGFAWALRADKDITDAFLAMDEAESLRQAELRGSACSVGAAVAAMSFAKRLGAPSSRLVMRGSSDELAPGGDSSVGYCAVAYSR